MPSECRSRAYLVRDTVDVARVALGQRHALSVLLVHILGADARGHGEVGAVHGHVHAFTGGRVTHGVVPPDTWGVAFCKADVVKPVFTLGPTRHVF